MNTIQRAAAAAALTLALTAVGTAANATPDTTVHADTYAQAYTGCAAQGWDAHLTNQCQWAAYRHFGGTVIAAYHASTDA